MVQTGVYCSHMEKNILNYRIIIEKEKNEDKKNKYVYSAYCPTLGLSDFGNTIDEAIKRITSLIEFHIESLSKLGHNVPAEKEITTVITSVSISASSHIKLSYV